MNWSSAWFWGGTVLVAVLLRLLMYVVQAVRTRRWLQTTLKAFPAPPGHLFLGVVQEIRTLNLLLTKTTEWANVYRDAYVLWVSFSLCVLRLTAPDTIKVILATAEPKDPFTYMFIAQLTGDGLLLSKGKKWARNRRLLTPAFHHDILKPYVSTFSESTRIMLDNWEKESKETGGAARVEMFGNVSLMTLDSLMKCIFGVHDQDIQTQGKQHPYIQAIYRISELALERFRRLIYLNDFIYQKTPAGFRFRQQVNIAHAFTRSVIDSKRKDKESAKRSESKYLSFVEILLGCKDADGNGLSYQEICDEVDTFMFEGHDTTAAGISWFFYNLARHPDIQQRCREEVNRVLGDKKDVEWSDLSKFDYLTQCMKESLRLHPPVPLIARTLTKPFTFPDGRTIPQGTRVHIGIYNLHHNKHVWRDPEVYDPERFSVENSKDRHPFAFIPFAAGPRNCIGQHFAYNEMKTCVAHVLRRFRLSLDDTRPEPLPIEALTLRTKHGLWLKCTPI